MISIKPQIQNQFNTATIGQITEYLLRNFNTFELVESLAELLQDQADMKPITISEAEFKAHFRIKGVKADGTPENRGKARKEDFKKNQ